MNPRLAPAHALRPRAFTAIAIAILLVCKSAPVAAQATHVGAGTPLAKPAKVNSFVKTSDGKFLWDDTVAYAGTSMPSTLRTFPGDSVDVVMQQCYGGGFASGMDSAFAGFTDYTFTAATNWNELAFNYQTYKADPKDATTLNVVDNFTRAFNDSLPRSEGLLFHYVDAVVGAAAAPPNGAVAQDPFAAGGAHRNVMKKIFENPSYASPDPLFFGIPNPVAPNNARDAVSAKQYAVLASWQPDNPKFDANLDRIYASLRARGVPANHIVVLAPGMNTAAIPEMTLAAVPITGAATEKNFKDAIAGTLFPAGLPEGDSHLLLYSTGHGSSWDNSGAKGQATVPVNPGPPKKVTVKTKDALDMPANAFADPDGDVDLGAVDLQFATRTPLDLSDLLGGVNVLLNGTPVGTLSNSILPFDLNPIIGTSFYYHLPVPMSLVNSLSPGPLTIDLDNLFASNVYDSLISAVTFDDYGDAWSIGVDPIPEPTSFILIATAFVGIAWRKRRQSRLAEDTPSERLCT